MKISLGSWAFSFGPYAQNPIPLEATARRLSAAGYDGIELCGFPPHVTPEAYGTAASRRELRQLFADVQLGVSGYAADLSRVNPVSEGNQRRYLDLFERNVELCAELGSPVIRVDTVAAPGSIPERDYGPAFERLAALWRQAAETAAQWGVRVVWEFEPGFEYNRPSEVLAMHEKVGHPNFQILFDTCHAYMCSVVGARQRAPRETLEGGPEELLEKLGGRIGHVHVIDSDATLHEDETSTHRPFGEGLVDFRALAPRLLALEGIEWWCIDLCFWPGGWDLVESSRSYVVKLLEGVRAT